MDLCLPRFRGVKIANAGTVNASAISHDSGARRKPSKSDKEDQKFLSESAETISSRVRPDFPGGLSF